MKGQLKELTDLVKSHKNISAVFVNVDILKINQVAMLQGAWQLPVFDRYSTYLLYLQLNFYLKIYPVAGRGFNILSNSYCGKLIGLYDFLFSCSTIRDL